MTGPEMSPGQGKGSALGCSGHPSAPAPAGAGVPGVWELEGDPTTSLRAGVGCCPMGQPGRTGYVGTQKLPFSQPKGGLCRRVLVPSVPRNAPFKLSVKRRSGL